MLKIKTGVTLLGLTPQMAIAAIAADGCFERHGYDCVITSGNDGRHSVKSKHYSGNALDFRTMHLPNPVVDGRAIAKELAEALGTDYDVIFENKEGISHIHIEFDPRGPSA